MRIDKIAQFRFQKKMAAFAFLLPDRVVRHYNRSP